MSAIFRQLPGGWEATVETDSHPVLDELSGDLF
jgi:hypothetical protein